MKDQLNRTWEIKDTAAGKGMCHRAQFVIIPHSLGKFIVSRPPCTEASCALWDPDRQQCRDVTNAVSLANIARSLRRLEDHLPPELP